MNRAIRSAGGSCARAGTTPRGSQGGTVIDEQPPQGPDPDGVAASDSGADGGDDAAHGTTPPPPTSRRRALLAVGAVATVLAVVAAVALWPAEESAAPTSTTTTTTTAPTTTTEAPAPDTFGIATVKDGLDTIKVLATEPEGWSDADPEPTGEIPDAPPRSQTAMPVRVALPTPDAPIQGRYAVDGGWEFANPGPFQPPQPFTMLVVEQRDDWVEVEVPVRPNGTTGWVAADDVDLSTTPYRIEVRLGERTLRAYKAGEQIVETRVVIGTPFTQTPTGRFYVTDIVPQTSAFYGPVALATNGYSELLDEFDNGVPVVALHGTSRPEQVGEAISYGCIRVPNEVIQQLAETVPRGAPVDIFP